MGEVRKACRSVAEEDAGRIQGASSAPCGLFQPGSRARRPRSRTDMRSSERPGRQGRRCMPLLRVVEVVAGSHPAPVLQHPDQAPCRQVVGDIGLEGVGEPHSLQRGGEQEAAVVEDQRPVDPHLEGKAVLLELPRVEPARLPVAVPDTPMLRQVMGHARRLVAREIGRRRHHGRHDIGADANGDHVLVHEFAEADAGVVTLGDDVDERIVDGHLDDDVVMRGE